MTPIDKLQTRISERFADVVKVIRYAHAEITLIVARENLLTVAAALRDEPDFQFNQLMDVCGVDYLQYGVSEWTTDSATSKGFERGVRMEAFQDLHMENKPRFAAVYHLLSTPLNQRVRLRVLLDEADAIVPSVIDLWVSANWFEREAFDLFGIMFHGHPDLRRILTDYGFVGHPFRKDFPLIGQVEARYDATLKRVVYEPVSIEPRVLEPKVIRQDNRYEKGE